MSERSICGWLLFSLLALMSPTEARAEAVRISGPLSACVSGFSIAPNGLTTVFRAGGLYAVPTGGGSRATLWIPIPATSVATSFAVSPDSSRVVFLAGPPGGPLFSYVTELYSVPIAGGTPVKISGTMVTGGAVTDFAISPDSSRVVFRSDKETDQLFELYSVPIDGGTTEKLSGSMVAGGTVSDFTISPDSSTVAFRAAKETAGIYELYAVPAAGGSATRLSGALVSGGIVWKHVISPDSAQVAFTAAKDDDHVVRLWSVPLAGGTAIKLSDAPLAPGFVATSFTITPDSGRVVFASFVPASFVEVELFSAALAGGDLKRLVHTAGTGTTVSEFVVSADGGQVVFTRRTGSMGPWELFQTPVTGGNIGNLSGSLAPGGSVFSFRLSSDGARVVFQASKESSIRDLFSVPISGGSATKLSGALVAGGSIDYQSGQSPLCSGQDGPSASAVVASFQISPDGKQVFFVADKLVNDVFELFAVPIGGGAVIRMSGALVAGGNVLGAAAATGNALVFLADKDTDNFQELYSAAVTGPLLDIDGDGIVDPLTDGLLLMRWQFGLRGDALIVNAVGANAKRKTIEAIEGYLSTLDAQPAAY